MSAVDARQGYDYERYSRLAGDFATVPTDRPHVVEFERLVGRDRRRGRALLLAFAAITFELLFSCGCCSRATARSTTARGGTGWPCRWSRPSASSRACD
jgi:hypothetical protein